MCIRVYTYISDKIQHCSYALRMNGNYLREMKKSSCYINCKHRNTRNIFRRIHLYVYFKHVETSLTLLKSGVG